MDAPETARTLNRAGAKKSDAAPLVIKTVGVIGAGQMGSGIAHVVALAGYQVAVNDLKREAYDQGLATIERNMGRQIGKGLIKDADAKAALKRISYAAAASDLAACDLVIEAATEHEAIKRKIFQDLCPQLKTLLTHL